MESAYCGGGKYLGMISGFAGAAAAAAAAAAVLQQAAAAESTWATSFHHHHPHPHYHHHPSPSKGVFLTFLKNLLCILTSLYSTHFQFYLHRFGLVAFVGWLHPFIVQIS